MKRAYYILALALLWGALVRASERDLYIEWKPVVGAVKYELKIHAGDGSEKSYQLDAKVQSFRKKLPPGYYEYSLRTWDRFNRPSRWTEAAPVKVAPPLAAPVFPAPETSPFKLDPENPAVDLKWRQSAGANRYEVEVRQDAETVFSQSTDRAELAFEPPRSGRYAWRARAVLDGFAEAEKVGAIASDWSTWIPFQVNFPQLAAPRLAKPRTRSLSIDTAQVKLKWEPVAAAKAYEVTWQMKPVRGPATAALNRKVVDQTQAEIRLPPEGVYGVTVRALASTRPSDRFDGAATAANVSFLELPDWGERDEIRVSSLPRAFSYYNESSLNQVNASGGGTAFGVGLEWVQNFNKAWYAVASLSNTSYQLQNQPLSGQRLNYEVGYKGFLDASRRWGYTLSGGAYLQRHIELLAHTDRGPSDTPFVTYPIGLGPSFQASVTRRWNRRWKSEFSVRAGMPLLTASLPAGSSGAIGAMLASAGLETQYWMQQDWAAAFSIGYQTSGIAYRRQGAAGLETVRESGFGVTLGVAYLWQ